MEVELKKVGLRLINVNIQDVTDVSGYIDALGQKAASKAINEARVKVSQADRDGQIDEAEARRDQNRLTRHHLERWLMDQGAEIILIRQLETRIALIEPVHHQLQCPAA